MKEIIRVVKFTLFSLSAGLIEIGTFTILNEVFKTPYWISYLTGLVLSVVWNFTLNRNFTFKASNNVPVAMFKVFIYYLIFTPTTTILGNYLVDKLLWNEYLVTIMNMALNLVTEFLYQRYVVFGKSIDTK